MEQFLTTQSENEVRLTAGPTIHDPKPVGPVAARLLPYAILAEQARIKDYYNGSFDADNFYISYYCKDNIPCDEAQVARDILSKWELMDAWQGRDDVSEEFKLRCARGPCHLLDGLAVQVWIKREPPCEEAVIAFRGTQGDPESWLSNFHWLTRHFGIVDQYDQVKVITDGLVARINNECKGRSPKIIAVGHSLGGGLAQHANYKNENIERIYGFNPTIVTGSLDFDAKTRANNAEGLVVERIYESGEALQFPRRVMGKLNPIGACDPRIVNVRFNFEHGTGADSQHRISNMVRNLMRFSKEVPEEKPIAEESCGESSGAGTARR